MLSHKRQISLRGLLDILRCIPLEHIIARERMIRLQQPLHLSREWLYHSNKEGILAREIIIEVAQARAGRSRYATHRSLQETILEKCTARHIHDGAPCVIF